MKKIHFGPQVHKSVSQCYTHTHTHIRSVMSALSLNCCVTPGRSHNFSEYHFLHIKWEVVTPSRLMPFPHQKEEGRQVWFCGFQTVCWGTLGCPKEVTRLSESHRILCNCEENSSLCHLTTTTKLFQYKHHTHWSLSMINVSSIDLMSYKIKLFLFMLIIKTI